MNRIKEEIEFMSELHKRKGNWLEYTVRRSEILIIALGGSVKEKNEINRRAEDWKL